MNVADLQKHPSFIKAAACDDEIYRHLSPMGMFGVDIARAVMELDPNDP